MSKELLDKELTPQQERFCQEYMLNGGNAGRAAIEAGYFSEGHKLSPFTQGSRLLNNVKIIQRLDELRKELKTSFASKDYIINGFKEIAERCMAEREVLDKDGNPTGVFQFDAFNAKGAYKEIATIVGHYEDGKRDETDEQAKALVNAIRAGMVLAKESIHDNG